VFSFFASRFEKRAVVTIIALHLLAISLPYLWALAVTPEGFVYGGLLYNPDDQNVHLSWARQASEGHFFFRDLFTTESLLSGERALFSNLLAWLVGVLSAITKIPLVWMYHVLRVLCAAIALFLFYALCARLTQNVRVRIVSLALAAFSGGAGFLKPLLSNFNWMDRADNAAFAMMPEAFTFASSFIFTLNIAAMALLLAVYLLSLHAWETGSRRAAIGAGAAALLLSNIHTYDVFPLLAALFVWAVFSRRSTPNVQAAPHAGSTQGMRWLFLPCVFIGALLPVAYQLFVFRSSEEFRVKALTVTAAPPIWDVLLSYGPLFLLALFGTVLAWRETKMRLPILWALAALILIYAPVSFARKMIEGVHLPFCFLAAIGIVALVSKLQTRPLRAVIVLGVLLTLSVSSFQFIAWTLDNARDNNASRAHVLMPPLYLSASDSQALQFLEKQPRGKVVLSLPLIGNYVPRETGQTAFIGHWAETLHFQNKLSEVLKFYSGQMSAGAANDWLRENHINYIFVGSYETQLGTRLPLELPVAHEKGGTTIYAVPPLFHREN
jgi:hypothetical protein